MFSVIIEDMTQPITLRGNMEVLWHYRGDGPTYHIARQYEGFMPLWKVGANLSPCAEI